MPTAIDISSNNGPVDFARVKGDGVDGVIIKATEGTSYVNPRFVHDWVAAHAAGLRVGSYHFSRQESHPTMAGARAEANHYLQTMAAIPGHHRAFFMRGNIIPVLDFETGTRDKRYSPWRDAFFEEVHRHTGHWSMLYTYPGFNSWTPPKKEAARLWIANYGVQHPTLPGGYHEWTGWQFTDRERVAGCAEPVDCSRFPDHLPLCQHNG